MDKNIQEEFNGFDYTTKAKEILAGDVEKLTVKDNEQGLTGNISKTDDYFNDDMIASSRIIDEILKKA